MIDWKKIAHNNGLNPKEFTKEILTVAACIGAMEIDKNGDTDTLKFCCSDDIGRLEVYIRRVPDNEIEDE